VVFDSAGAERRREKRWDLKCPTCFKLFEVPLDERPLDPPPVDRAILAMAVPQHPDPHDPDEMCAGSSDVTMPQLRSASEDD
jgi:hypothetical protein